MKKLYVGLAIAAVFGYLGVLGVGAAQAWSGAPQACTGDCQAGPGMGWNGGPAGEGVLSQYETILDSSLAKVLNLSVEEVQAARDNGTTWPELASKQSVALADVQQSIVEAHQAMIDQALADGAITLAQAEAMKQHLEQGPGLGFQGRMLQAPGSDRQPPGVGGRGGFGRR
jgi:hypothetical protein